MKVLVTGGAGFIGSHLVERLIERGDEVYVIDDLSTGSLANLAAVRQHARLHLAVDSILNYHLIEETVAKCDQVVHLAAVVGVKKVLDEPVNTITTNVRGSEILLENCDRNGTPLFVASTSEIYGKAGEKLNEDHDRIMGSTANRRWAYACTKTMDEFLALAYHQERELPVIIGRMFNVVGPRQTGQWGMVLPTFVAAAMAGEPIRVFGDGSQRRCFLHVDDMVEAVLRLLSTDEAWGRVFNIGVEDEITILDLAHKVKERTGSESDVEVIPYDEAYGSGFEDMERRQPDTTRLRTLTGWAPTYDLDQIIDASIAFLRERGAVASRA